MENRDNQWKTPIWLKLCLWIGVAGIGQYVVFAIIGVVRGYSVQSMTPTWVMMGGYILFLLASQFGSRKIQARSSMISSFCLIPYLVGGTLQGRYQTIGDEFYQQKNYPAAITMYQKEVNTWYLRLGYNYNEQTSWFGIAQAYCQLENYKQARETYQTLFKMARGYYKERAQEELANLDSGLENIDTLEKQLVNAVDDCQKANILFDMALSYRYDIGCEKKAKEQYALIQMLNIEEHRKEQAKKFATEP
jgi:tetratricopeptide (TPR) repeat protein